MNSYFCDSCKLKLEGNPVAVHWALRKNFPEN